jgi:hypothetical protein
VTGYAILLSFPVYAHRALPSLTQAIHDISSHRQSFHLHDLDLQKQYWTHLRILKLLWLALQLFLYRCTHTFAVSSCLQSNFHSFFGFEYFKQEMYWKLLFSTTYRYICNIPIISHLCSSSDIFHSAHP